MKQRYTLAVALALALSGMAVGLAGGPVAAQDDRAEDSPGPGLAASSSSDCPSTVDFEIAEKHGNAKTRQLNATEEKIGLADVVSGTDELLRVHMETSNAELGIEVFFLDQNDECSEYTPSDCDETVTQTIHRTICTLEAPEDRDYWVHYTNEGAIDLEFHTWTPND